MFEEYQKELKKPKSTTADIWRIEFLAAVQESQIRRSLYSLFRFLGVGAKSVADCNFLELAYHGNPSN